MSNGIFAVDRRVWNRVCDLGINAAITYLILARGTGGDNRTTSWSTQAVESKTTISRPRAKAAIANLIDGGLVARIKGGSRPRYFILPPESIAGMPQALTADEERVFAFLSGISDIEPKNWQAVARRLSTDGKIEYRDDEPQIQRKFSNPDWIWLPNSLVDGAASETVPVELLHQTQNLDAVRLLVNLYHCHHLSTDGGVEWRYGLGLRITYERKKLFEHGEWIIWAFETKTTKATHNLPAVREHHAALARLKVKNDDVWDRLWAAKEALISSGLMEDICHVVNGDGESGEIIHPLPFRESGEPSEQRVTQAASDLCDRLLPSELRLQKSRYWGVFPARRHMQNVTLVGILRMKYRPQTAATAAWLMQTKEHLDWAAMYDLQHQGGIKVASR